jgi:hypothetical protein
MTNVITYNGVNLQFRLSTFSYVDLKIKNSYGKKDFSQHLFFITCEWAQQVRVLHCTSLERLTRGKHSSLIGPFVRYEQSEVLVSLVTSSF